MGIIKGDKQHSKILAPILILSKLSGLTLGNIINQEKKLNSKGTAITIKPVINAISRYPNKICLMDFSIFNL